MIVWQTICLVILLGLYLPLVGSTTKKIIGHSEDSVPSVYLVAEIRFDEVGNIFTVTMWLLVVCFARIGKY